MRNYDDNILDIFRVAATIQVFVGHIGAHFTPSIVGEEIFSNIIHFIRGVPVLLVLCGFLAAKSLDGRTAKKWLLGRMVRLMPAFWVCILINTVVIAFLYPIQPSLKEGAIYLATQFSGLNFYTGDWLREYGIGAPNGALWTICVQIQFFILAPFIHRFLQHKSFRNWCVYIAMLTLLSVACNSLNGRIPEVLWKLLGVTAIPYLYFLMFGMMLWYHRDTIIPAAERFRWHLLIAYILWKCMENLFAFPHIADGVLYNTVPTLLLALVIAAFGFCGRVRVRTDYTYGFYLYHMVFINIFVELGQNSFFPIHMGLWRVAVVVLATLAAAYLSKRFIETPTARFAKRKWENI